MMAELTDYLENGLLDHFLNTSAYTPTACYLALHTTVCSDSTPGTEVAGNGYARQLCVFNAASGGSAGNAAQEEFAASGGNFGTVVATSLYNALTVGNQLVFDNDFADTAVNDGQTLRFAATTGIIISLD